MATSYITLARLHALLIYYPETGLFFWTVDRGRNAKAGDIAGFIHNTYICIEVDGRCYRAHRLAWFYVTGQWPTHHIDHKDGNKSNNIFDNLREATMAQNKQNLQKAPRNNVSCGLLGVTRRGNRWSARIEYGDKRRSLGNYATPEEAHQAYLIAKRNFHPFGMI